MLAKIHRWRVAHPQWTLTWLTLVVLAPFLVKPLAIDDPLFVWMAKQAQAHPGDPFGFDVNWIGVSLPAWQVMLNPPLTAYYLAVAAHVVGWSEWGMHLAMWPMALAVVLGTFRLAKQFTQRPLLAALCVLFTPGFLVCSTMVMCDVPMLAGWVWTIVFWVEGIEQNRAGKLATAGVIAALTVLTKYNGCCLVPLLALHGIITRRHIGWWAAWLLIPVAALGLHDWWMAHHYGHAHFLGSNQYANSRQTLVIADRIAQAITALTFMGGCFASLTFCAPALWRKRIWCSVGGGIFIFVIILASGVLKKTFAGIGGGDNLLIAGQIGLWTAGGAAVLALAAGELRAKRDAARWLLAAWVAGIFIFAAFCYWMLNARVILPMLPAVGILVACRLERRDHQSDRTISTALVASATLALWVAWADCTLAAKGRSAAEQICAEFVRPPTTLWFEGHWGFQYYMEANGAHAVDFKRSEARPTDLLVLPNEQTNVRHPGKTWRVIAVREINHPLGLTTMDTRTGAGLHASAFGPLPFAFGSAPPATIGIYTNEAAH